MQDFIFLIPLENPQHERLPTGGYKGILKASRCRSRGFPLIFPYDYFKYKRLREIK